MNAKVKSSLILAGVLITGAAIGFEISEISIKREFEKMESFRKPKGFVSIFNDIIKPSDAQKKITDSILVSYHDRIDSVSNLNMQTVGALIDSMNIDLSRVISPEQKKALDEEMLRMKKHPHPPPPPENRK